MVMATIPAAMVATAASWMTSEAASAIAAAAWLILSFMVLGVDALAPGRASAISQKVLAGSGGLCVFVCGHVADRVILIKRKYTNISYT